MRISPRRHNLARLRLMLKLHQQEFADLVGCSKASIQSIELDRGLKLSEELARRISAATGVDAGWLLENNLLQPPRTPEGELYTELAYETTQALLKSGATMEFMNGTMQSHDHVLAAAGRLYWLINTMVISQDQALPIVLWRLSNFLNRLEDEFGGPEKATGYQNRRDFPIELQAVMGITLIDSLKAAMSSPKVLAAKAALKAILPEIKHSVAKEIEAKRQGSKKGLKRR